MKDSVEEVKMLPAGLVVNVKIGISFFRNVLAALTNSSVSPFSVIKIARASRFNLLAIVMMILGSEWNSQYLPVSCNLTSFRVQSILRGPVQTNKQF